MFFLDGLLGNSGPRIVLAVAAIVFPQFANGVLHALGVAFALTNHLLDLSVWDAGWAQLTVLNDLSHSSTLVYV